MHRSAIAFATALTVLCMAARAHDRRVVDTVIAGNSVSEIAHGYAGHDATSGMVDGKSFRAARGWMRYALTTFDDTEVTLAWTFAPSAGEGANVSREYDVLVEDSVVATRSYGASSSTVSVVEIVVPFALTKGRTNIAVMLRAHGGSTPALREVRVIQDHNEQMDEAQNEQQRVRHTPQAIR